MKKFVLFFALAFGASFFAAAQSVPQVRKTQAKQTVRIAHGVRNSELTSGEAKQLKGQQKHIQKEKRVAKTDGVVTRSEKVHIRHDQKIANRSIYLQKHDVQKRF